MKIFKFQVFHWVIVEQSEIKVGGMVRTIVSMASSETNEGGMVRTIFQWLLQRAIAG